MACKRNTASSHKDTAVPRHAAQPEESLSHMGPYVAWLLFEKQPSEISRPPQICLMALLHGDWRQTAPGPVTSFGAQERFSQAAAGKNTVSFTIGIQHDLTGPREMDGAAKSCFLIDGF